MGANQHFYVEVQTADEGGAGTDANISVEFTWKSGLKTGFQVLNNPGNDFEKNSNDFYVFDGPVATGQDLATVTIKHDGAGAGSAWKLAWLKVSVDQKTWKAVPPDKFIDNQTLTLALSPAIGRLDWMSALSPSLTIDQLNIPGTHDSGTSYLGRGNYRHTQDLTIAEQLQLGIRYFDIRLRCLVNPGVSVANLADDQSNSSPTEANFSVHHEDSWCKIYFDKESWIVPGDEPSGFVLQDMLDFLGNFPSEFILLQIQQEHNDAPNFALHFQRLLSRHGIEKFLVTSHYPTVEEAKGKIVILSMNAALGDVAPFGIPLQGPMLYDTPTLFVENHWMDSNKELKWDKVEIALKKALQNNSGQWVINFVSDGSGAMHPRTFASYLNGWVEEFIIANGPTNHYGTILVDFPTRSLVSTILTKYLQ